MEKESKSLNKSVELIAENTAKILERVNKIENNMTTKDDLKEVRDEIKLFKLETHTNFNDMLTDIKSFKKDTQNNFDEINEKLDDLSDTDEHFDKRIEKLENKVFA